jgi:predicted metal-dependent peptidase
MKAPEQIMQEIMSIQVPPEDVLNTMLSRTKGAIFTGGPEKGAGFLGSLMCDHKYVWDNTCMTAWSDGKVIGWNPRFYLWLTPAERVTVLAHELWHTAYDHMGRVYDRCPDVWNKAADFVINLALKDMGYVFGENLMSLGPCLDEQYRDMHTEQVYDLLPKPPGSPPPCPTPPDPDGSGQAPGQDKPQQGQDDPLGGDIRVPGDQSPAAKAEQMGKIIKARQAAKMSDKPGLIPGEIELVLEEYLSPILPWEVLLQRFFTELSNDDYSWKRPSRRYDEEYLPSLLSDNGLEHLIYYWDISGSITDAIILRCHSELKYIHDMLAPKKLTIVTFDTKIQDVYEFTDDMPYDKITVHGRGGTCLIEVQEHIKKHRPSAAVIFSDMFVKPMKQDPGSPILWIVIGNKKAKVPFGRMVHIPRES